MDDELTGTEVDVQSGSPAAEPEATIERDEKAAPDDSAAPEEKAAPDENAAPRRTLWRRLGAAAIVVAGILILAVALDFGTSSSAVCESCHEIRPRVESWRHSAHAGVECVQCHEEPNPWYAVPQRLYERGRLLGRDVAKHVIGDYTDPVDSRTTSASPVPDSRCLACHDPNRQATSGYRILIDHAEHAERNGSCVSCHVRTAHPVETRSLPLSLMAQCFTCHGNAKSSKAPGTCDLCHPSDYEPRPASHSAAKWEKGHGGVAQEDPRQCVMCHEQSFCTSCHGIEMPHPLLWVEGDQGHSVAAKMDREVCDRCHGDRPDWCTQCHHTTYDAAKGTWEKQHPDTVDAEGTVGCMKCHPPNDCVRCHTK